MAQASVYSAQYTSGQPSVTYSTSGHPSVTYSAGQPLMGYSTVGQPSIAYTTAGQNIAYSTAGQTSLAHSAAGQTSVGYSTASYTASGAAEIPTGQRMLTGGGVAGGERVQSTRKVSSTIIDEQYLGPMPQDMPTREVVVQGPPVEEVKYVTKKEVREIEKRVPKYEYEWVERVVEVPRIEYVEKKVDKPKYVEKIVERKVPKIEEIIQEVAVEVKVPKITYVEKVVEVPGEVISVDKPYVVEQPYAVNQYRDVQVPLVVAQTIRPYVVEGQGVHEVDVYEYEPELVPVDVHVIKPVSAQLVAGGVVETMHRVITVPAAQYNTLLHQLNVHLTEAEKQKLPYLSNGQGQVTMLGERISYSQPQAGVSIQGWNEATSVRVHKETSAVTTTSTTTGTGTGTAVSIGGPYITSGGQYASGSQYASGNQYVSRGQYASSGQYVSGGQYASQSYSSSGPVYQQHAITTTTSQAYPAGVSYSSPTAARPVVTSAVVAH